MHRDSRSFWSRPYGSDTGHAVADGSLWDAISWGSGLYRAGLFAGSSFSRLQEGAATTQIRNAIWLQY